MAQRNLQVNKSELKELAKQALSATTQQPTAAPSPRKRSLSWILPTSIIAIILAIGLYSLLGWQKSDVSVLSSLNNKLNGKEPIFKMSLSTDAKIATLLLTDIKSNGAESTAFISIENQSSKPYTVGQEVLKSAIVKNILTDHVLIQYNDSIITLYLEGKGFAALSSGETSGNNLSNPVSEQDANDLGSVMPPSEYFQRNVAVIPDPAGSGGFVVQSVEPMSPYALFGVRPGDVVYNLDGKPYYSFWEHANVFEVYRNGQRLLLNLDKQ
jgi:type II secretory pathway component PulC